MLPDPGRTFKNTRPDSSVASAFRYLMSGFMLEDQSIDWTDAYPSPVSPASVALT